MYINVYHKKQLLLKKENIKVFRKTLFGEIQTTTCLFVQSSKSTKNLLKYKNFPVTVSEKERWIGSKLDGQV